MIKQSLCLMFEMYSPPLILKPTLQVGREAMKAEPLSYEDRVAAMATSNRLEIEAPR